MRWDDERFAVTLVFGVLRFKWFPVHLRQVGTR